MSDEPTDSEIRKAALLVHRRRMAVRSETNEYGECKGMGRADE